jgi:hypothetical protein
MDKRIRKIVLDQLGGGSDAIRSAIDAASYGADAGFCGFTYYSDTCGLVDDHPEVEVWADMEAEDLGHNSWLTMAAQAHQVSSLITAKNWLAWFALESVGHYYREIFGKDRA